MKGCVVMMKIDQSQPFFHKLKAAFDPDLKEQLQGLEK